MVKGDKYLFNNIIYTDQLCEVVYVPEKWHRVEIRINNGNPFYAHKSELKPNHP